MGNEDQRVAGKHRTHGMVVSSRPRPFGKSDARRAQRWRWCNRRRLPGSMVCSFLAKRGQHERGLSASSAPLKFHLRSGHNISGSEDIRWGRTKSRCILQSSDQAPELLGEQRHTLPVSEKTILTMSRGVDCFRKVVPLHGRLLGLRSICLLSILRSSASMIIVCFFSSLHLSVQCIRQKLYPCMVACLGLRSTCLLSILRSTTSLITVCSFCFCSLHLYVQCIRQEAAIRSIGDKVSERFGLASRKDHLSHSTFTERRQVEARLRSWQPQTLRRRQFPGLREPGTLLNETCPLLHGNEEANF